MTETLAILFSGETGQMKSARLWTLVDAVMAWFSQPSHAAQTVRVTTGQHVRRPCAAFATETLEAYLRRESRVQYAVGARTEHVNPSTMASSTTTRPFDNCLELGSAIVHDSNSQFGEQLRSCESMGTHPS